jgi:hypothetical protein
LKFVAHRHSNISTIHQCRLTAIPENATSAIDVTGKMLREAKSPGTQK